LVATAGPPGDGATPQPVLDDRRQALVYMRDTLDQLVS
jgi:hypothetical protein